MEKKVALFIPSLDIGGVEKVFVNLANQLIEFGYEVEFVVCKRQGGLLNQINPRIELLDFGGIRLGYSLWKLIKFFNSTEAEVIISGPTYPNLLCILGKFLSRRKIRLIITHHNFQDIEMKGLGIRGRVMPMLIKLLYNYADVVIAVSDGLKSAMIRNLNVNPKLIHRIYNPVLNPSFYIKATEYAPVDLLPDGYDHYCVAVGRLEEVKNFDAIIKAFALLRSNDQCGNLKLVIVGDGIQFHALQKLVKECHLQSVVHFTGGVANPLPLIKGADLLIQSSLSESFSIVIIEALALDIPVISTETIGAKEILSGESHTFIKMNHPKSIADYIVNFSQERRLSSNLNLEQYNIDYVCSQYIKLFYKNI